MKIEKKEKIAYNLELTREEFEEIVASVGGVAEDELSDTKGIICVKGLSPYESSNFYKELKDSL